MSIFSKIGHAAKSSFSSIGSGFKNLGKFVQKNDRKILGGAMVLAGGVASATGLGAAIGVPLMSAGAGVAAAKSKKDAIGAAVNTAVSAGGSALMNSAVAGKVIDSATSKVSGLAGSKVVTSFAKGVDVVKAAEGKIMKMNPPLVNTLAKLDSSSVAPLKGILNRSLAGGAGKIANGNTAFTIKDSANLSQIVSVANATPSNVSSNTTEKVEKVKTVVKKYWKPAVGVLVALILLVVGVKIAKGKKGKPVKKTY